jgi:hypothetical protein
MSAKTAYSLNAHDVTCKFVESILHVAVRSILSKLSGRRISFTEAPLTGPTTQGSNSLSPISLWHEMISKFDRVTDDLTYHDLVVLEREARGVPWVYDLIGYVCILKGYRTANPDVINRHVFTELRRFLEFLRQVWLNITAPWFLWSVAQIDICSVELRRLRRACNFFANKMQNITLIKQLLNEAQADNPNDHEFSISVTKVARFVILVMLCHDEIL